MQPLIVQGDKTSHGGTVVGGSSLSYCDDKPIARIGDMVSCPKCRGIFPIVEGDQFFIIDDAAVSYHGCKTACGATLISNQNLMFLIPSSSGESGNSTDILDGFGSIGDRIAAAYEGQAHDQASKQFRGRFHLLSIEDGKPIADRRVRIRSTAGRDFIDTTDAQGYTSWVEHGASEALSFDLGVDSE
jgi:uncharacterized Zn-binding protein involved in type VI secretion